MQLTLRIYISLLFITLSNLIFAQEIETYTIIGNIYSKEDSLPLINASVAVYDTQDSSLIRGVASNFTGAFSFSVKPDDYQLKISYTGNAPFIKNISIENKDVNLGDIYLSGSVNLSEVLIESAVVPVQIKGDTTQFNSAAYKTNPDASTEDLLKKLPGLMVKDGQVSAQGETVTKVLVDGKEFFGEDPSIAIKNIPAYLIDKVQVYDQQSDQSEFTGFDDGNREKTINVITKKGMKNGEFGKMYAAYGTDNRYNAGLSLNHFKEDRRISLLGLSNNINMRSFSGDEDMSVGRGGRSSSAGGISKINSGGVNYSDKLSEKAELSGSYFFNKTENERNSATTRNYFLDEQQSFEEALSSFSDNQNHRINLKLKYTPDSSNTIIARPNFTYQTNTSTSRNSSQSFIDNEAVNSSNSTQNNNNSGYNFRNYITWNHKFNKKGRTISLRIMNSANDNSGINTLTSTTEYFEEDSVYRQNQQTKSESNRQNHNLRLTYTEPIGKGLLQFSYNPSLQLNNSDRYTYLYDVDNSDYNTMDTLLSNVYNNQTTIQRGGLQYMIKNGKNSNLSFGVELQNTVLEGEQLFPMAFETKKSFFAILPEARFRKRINQSTNFNIFYRTSTNVPSITELQNVLDNTNPLRLRIGNENLEEELSHRLRLNYTSGNSEKGTSFSASLNGSVTENHIGRATYLALTDTTINGIYLSRGAQLSMPVNLENQYNSSLHISYGFPLDIIKSKLNLTGSTNYSNTPGIINGQKNRSNDMSYGLGITLASNISERIDFTLSGNGAYTNTKNTLETSEDYNYYTQTTSAEIYIHPWKGLVFTSNLNYTSYYGLNSDYNQDIFLWNAGVGYKFLKNNAAELKLTAFDLLNQNKSISRSATESYVQDSQTLVLKRYLMLTFTYNINNFR